MKLSRVCFGVHREDKGAPVGESGDKGTHPSPMKWLAGLGHPSLPFQVLTSLLVRRWAGKEGSGAHPAFTADRIDSLGEQWCLAPMHLRALPLLFSTPLTHCLPH